MRKMYSEEQIKKIAGGGGGKLYKHKINGSLALNEGQTIFYNIYYISPATDETLTMSEIKMQIENGVFVGGDLTISAPGNEWYGVIGSFNTNISSMYMPPQGNGFMVNTQTGAAQYKFMTFEKNPSGHKATEIK